jgi:hypothetical protein
VGESIHRSAFKKTLNDLFGNFQALWFVDIGAGEF